jgi:hypothetical protein
MWIILVDGWRNFIHVSKAGFNVSRDFYNGARVWITFDFDWFNL